MGAALPTLPTTAQDIDVCLLLEGTYPYVRGGVSGWMHQIITGLPEVRFAVVFVGGRRADYGEARYELPDNVVALQHYYLEDALRGHTPRLSKLDDDTLQEVQRVHAYFRGEVEPANDGCPFRGALDRLLLQLERRGGLRLAQFLCSDGAWDFMRALASAHHPDTPFVDYFWTLRLMHGPVFQLARIADTVPDARAYHTISTGYAGFLGALLERRRGRPLLLSEHGIYTKERRIDLNQATWLDRPRNASVPGLRDPSASLRALWVRYFETLGRITYLSANPIISLYEGNRQRQHDDGASPERTRVIVNGIAPARFEAALAARPQKPPHVIGLIGRVVPIKDVKTFIRAMGVVRAAVPDAQGWIIGGADEDPAYAADCEALVEGLGLGDGIRFLGFQNVLDMLPQLGLLMLTSISEAQPLAILEAFAAGVPCVATDVGACREQIDGRTEPDQALGRAGRVVPFADPDALGNAAVELLSDEATWRACQTAGLSRVRAYYAQDAMLQAYRDLYREALAS